MNKLFVFVVMLYLGLFFDNFNIFRYCILSSILHEIGHVIAYSLCTGKFPKIEVSVFGFKIKNNVLQPENLIFILISGPLMNLLAVILVMILIKKQATFNLYIFGIINLIIFVFNILPVYYLDGGQILYCFSEFYQRNYIKISVLTLILLSVMLICFTDVSVLFLLFPIYFICNSLNDI